MAPRRTTVMNGGACFRDIFIFSQIATIALAAVSISSLAINKVDAVTVTDPATKNPELSLPGTADCCRLKCGADCDCFIKCNPDTCQEELAAAEKKCDMTVELFNACVEISKDCRECIGCCMGGELRVVRITGGDGKETLVLLETGEGAQGGRLSQCSRECVGAFLDPSRRTRTTGGSDFDLPEEEMTAQRLENCLRCYTSCGGVRPVAMVVQGTVEAVTNVSDVEPESACADIDDSLCFPECLRCNNCPATVFPQRDFAEDEIEMGGPRSGIPKPCAKPSDPRCFTICSNCCGNCPAMGPRSKCCTKCWQDCPDAPEGAPIPKRSPAAPRRTSPLEEETPEHSLDRQCVAEEACESGCGGDADCLKQCATRTCPQELAAAKGVREVTVDLFNDLIGITGGRATCISNCKANGGVGCDQDSTPSGRFMTDDGGNTVVLLSRSDKCCGCYNQVLTELAAAKGEREVIVEKKREVDGELFRSLRMSSSVPAKKSSTNRDLTKCISDCKSTPDGKLCEPDQMPPAPGTAGGRGVNTNGEQDRNKKCCNCYVKFPLGGRTVDSFTTDTGTADA